MPSAWSQRSCSLRRLFLLKGLQGSAGLMVAAMGLWVLVTSATGRCPGYVPFGISTLRERQVQPPIARSKQPA